MLTYPLPANTIAFVKNPIEWVLKPENSDIDHFLVSLYVEDVWLSGDYELKVTWLEHYMIDGDGNKYSKFDISELLKAYVSPLTAELFQDAVDQPIMRRYYLTFYNVDDEGSNLETETSDVQTAVYGGLQQQKWKNYSEIFFTQLLANKNFLTWAPSGMKILADHAPTLLFLSPVTTTIIHFIKKSYYEDGTTATIVLAADIPDPVAWQSLALVDLESIADDVVKIEVWASNGTWDGTVVTFKIDRNIYRQTKKLKFNNSIGGFDNFFCTGTYLEEYEYTGDSKTVIPLQYAGGVQGMRSEQVIEREEQNTYAASTGWKTKEEIDYFREALLANELYEEVDNATSAVPIEILPDTLRIFSSDAKMFAIQFKYKYQFSNNSFTPKTFSAL